MGTPPPSTEPQLNAASNSTPIRQPKHVIKTSVITSGLESGRKAVMEDIGYAVPEVPMSYFQESLLPPLRPEFGDLSDILARLKASGHIDDGRWALFKTLPAQSKQQAKGTEDVMIDSSLCYPCVGLHD